MKNFCQSCKSKGRGNVEMKEEQKFGSYQTQYRCPLCNRVE